MARTPRKVSTSHAVTNIAALFLFLQSVGCVPSYCGIDFHDASRCKHQCSSANGVTCPPGQHCFTIRACTQPQASATAIISPISGAARINQSNQYRTARYGLLPPWLPQPSAALLPDDRQSDPRPSRWCGSTFADSGKCEQLCPNGVDRECPSGERCFADVICLEAQTLNPGTSPSSAVSEPVEDKPAVQHLSGLEKFGIIVGVVSSVVAIAGGMWKLYSCFRKERVATNRDDVDDFTSVTYGR